MEDAHKFILMKMLAMKKLKQEDSSEAFKPAQEQEGIG